MERKTSENRQKIMTFWDHLDELRKRLIICIIALVITTAAAYPFHNFFLDLLLKPAGSINLNVLEVLEPFKVNMLISFFIGIAVSFPILSYQIIQFISPAVGKKQKKIIIPLTIIFFVLFAAGVVFSYKMLLPNSIRWLLAQGQGLQLTLALGRYVSFVGWFLIASGVTFEMPLVILALVKVGILDRKTLRKKWRIAYITIFIIAAIITPDWSPVTMLSLALPMLLLYELSMLLAKII